MSSNGTTDPQVASATDVVPLTTSSLLHINMINVTKLISTNYLMCNRQVNALLDGYNLGHFLDVEADKPDPTITTAGSTAANPAYVVWTRQDKLIYSAILGAISLDVQPLLSHASTSIDVRTTLSSTYAKRSRGHILQLKHQVSEWRKGNRSIDEYVQGLTMWFDQLAFLGKPEDHEDQIRYILKGLREDYKTVVDQTEGRAVAPSIPELHENILNLEATLLTSSHAASVPITANYANSHQRSKPFHPRQHNNNNQGWYHNNNGGHNRSSKPSLGKCQICGTQGNSARRCPQFQSPQAQRPLFPTPRANIAQSSTPWIMDSGATHHITSDFANLSIYQPYTGGEEVLVGDGTGLPILHMGSASLPFL
ncbi:PREDICTED: uncharacterized protein LOC104708847 [Camelina sativa]|uniref:Uncharacterized protein LOC104708847 n=1 Tax=Camelina sativa TaxID=90675 RepID=A0ABM0TBN4_CAMSA|nr:PREDICTED: uncharacterized protein LOC104708847 [Camelina sativa]